jgi:RNA polymerase sigma-70 factor (ECF subfamily)
MDPTPSASPQRAAEDAEIRDRVRAAVATLPERQRLAIQLIDIDGYGAAEVAAMLDLSPVTMRWHLMAARRTLRQLLAPLANAYSGPAGKIVNRQSNERESRDGSSRAPGASDADRRTKK